MLLGLPKSAICVQRFDDSLNSAIRITYRISLRSSSLREPRYPLLRVVFYVQVIKRVNLIFIRTNIKKSTSKRGLKWLVVFSAIILLNGEFDREKIAFTRIQSFTSTQFRRAVFSR